MKSKHQTISGFKLLTSTLMTLVWCLRLAALAQVVESPTAPLAPKTGSYYSAQKPAFPPLPFNPVAGVPVFEFAPGVFVYDDRKIDYDAWRVAAAPQSDSTVSASAQSAMSAANYGCALWLEIGRPTNSALPLTLHNTMPGTNYQILSKTNLSDASWTTETNIIGASGQDFTVVSIPILQRSNLFFVASEARSYFLETNFAGLQFTDEIGINPPDTMGAVGPDHFVELINGWVAVFNKTNGQILEQTNSSPFFSAGGPPPGFPMIDPRILYDHQAQAWLACAIENSGTKEVRLAVCTNSNPAGLVTNWTRHLLFQPPPGFDSDYTTLGLDANGVYLTIHHRAGNSTTNAGHTIIALKKPELYQGTLVTNHFRIDPAVTNLKVWTVQPAVNFDAVSTNAYAWLVAKGPPQLGTNYQGGAILCRRLQWSNTTARLVDSEWQPVLQSPEVNYRDYYDVDGTNILTRPTTTWLSAPQSNSATRIDLTIVGSRLMNAVIREGFLYTCQHIGLSGTNGIYVGNEFGTNADRSAVQWVKVRVEDNALSYYKHGRIYDAAPINPEHYYFPSIAVNCAADMVLGFSGSREASYIGAYFVWRAGEGSHEDAPLRFTDGGGFYFEGRWGDYSATTLDPNDAMSFWTIQEHATDRPLVWATSIAKIGRR